MTIGFVCLVTHGNLAEKISQYPLMEKDEQYWFFSDGTLFQKDFIGMQWSNSTYRAVNDASGRFLELITKPGSGEAVRLTAPRVRNLIEKIREHVSTNALDPEIEKDGDLSYVTVHNLLATFDKMVAEHGDDARFCLT
jgi:hypothetical protein